MNLDNLPVEWSVSQLTKMIASEGLISDGDWIESKDQDEKGDIRLIQLADIGDGDFRDKSNRYMNQDAFDRLNCVELKANDVLIARMPDPLGRACIFPKLPYKCVTVVDVCLIRTGERSAISPKLLKYWINSTQLRNLIALNATGTTRKRITRKKLESFDFPVPPLAEQQEIVRQLDVMLAQVEQIKARLDAIPAILKKFRQSVLADAVSGELINQDFSQLPVESFSDYLTDVRYGTSKKCSESLIDAVPVLRIPNIADDGTLDFTNLKYAEFDSKEVKQLQLSKGDLMLIRSNGSLDLVGKSAIADELDRVVLYAGYLIRLRFNDSVNSQFIQYYLKAPQTRQIIENIARSTSGVNNINSKEIANLKIQLPCIDHQNEVVLRVQKLLELSKRVEETIQSAQKRVNLLTQSILAKAFSGELTAEWREQHQDLITGINSAESLLAAIQAEREASKPAKKTRKKKEV